MEENIQEFTITEENREVIGFTNKTENLVIPEFFIGEGTGGTTDGQKYRVTKIGKKAFAGTNVQIVRMPNSVRLIEQEAFSKCNCLTGITLSENLEAIELGAFYDCKNMKDLKLPKELELIWIQAFYGCASLTHITIPNKTRIIGARAFDNCPNLQTISGEKGNKKFFSTQHNKILIDMKHEYSVWVSATLPELVLGKEVISLFHTDRDFLYMGENHLKTIFIPETVNSIPKGLLSNCVNCTIIVNKQKESIPNAPWGAGTAYVYWIG